LNVVSYRYPLPTAMPSATAFSHAFPLTSCHTPTLALMPLPALNRDRTVLPEPFGATRTTSMSFGGTTFVSAANTGEKPCEK
jgi:hypothetical protein